MSKNDALWYVAEGRAELRPVDAAARADEVIE
jgi:hypothetical protein